MIKFMNKYKKHIIKGVAILMILSMIVPVFAYIL